MNLHAFTHVNSHKLGVLRRQEWLPKPFSFSVRYLHHVHKRHPGHSARSVPLPGRRACARDYYQSFASRRRSRRHPLGNVVSSGGILCCSRSTFSLSCTADFNSTGPLLLSFEQGGLSSLVAFGACVRLDSTIRTACFAMRPSYLIGCRTMERSLTDGTLKDLMLHLLFLLGSFRFKGQPGLQGHCQHFDPAYERHCSPTQGAPCRNVSRICTTRGQIASSQSSGFEVSTRYTYRPSRTVATLRCPHVYPMHDCTDLSTTYS